jgi:ATP-dependent Clp protease ATP-binding subunit ClpA
MTGLNDKTKVYFREPFLELSVFSQSLLRVLRRAALIILAIAVFVFLFSGEKRIFYGGLLGLIFLLDSAFHWNRGRVALSSALKREKINLADSATPQTMDIIASAFQYSLLAGGSFYLWLNKYLFDLSEVREAAKRMEADPAEILQKINESLSAPSAPNKREALFTEVEKLMFAAVKVALAGGSRYITPIDLFAGQKFSSDKEIGRIFNLFEIDTEDLENVAVFSRFISRVRFSSAGLPETIGGFASKFNGVRHRAMNRAWTARPTPTLDLFGTDLTDLARAGETGFMVGHEKEYERMVNILSRPNKPNAVLVGDPGVGTNTIVKHLAYMIIKDEVPDILFDRRVVSLNISSLVSGADQAELQRRINNIFEEIHRAGNVVLYIPEIHNLSRTSGEFFLSAANVIMPLVTSSEFPTIGTTYPQEFRQFIERDSAFMEAFEFIKVEEITEDEAIRFLSFAGLLFEKHWKIRISFGAVKTAVALAKKYFHNQPLPAPASDLMKEAVADAKRRRLKTLNKEDIIRIAETRTNIPIKGASREEAKKLLNLEEVIHRDLIDQEEAVSAVARVLREYRSGLSRSGGPIATFLFVGPTGVGKTELAKILTKTQFGLEKMMVRLDMSEYQDKTSFFRLIGSPDGKVTGFLTEAVMAKPYSLVLLDEFEKAHPDVLNLFLQVFDDGRLTDNLGRTVDFQNTIIIATSNAHSAFIKASLEESKTIAAIVDEFKKKLVDYFRPELLNRFSDIIIFKTLTPENVIKITRLQLDKLAKSLSEEQGIEIVFEDGAVRRLAELGFDPVFGARPLRKTISERVKAPLAEKILAGETMRGSRVNFCLKNNELKMISE